VNLRRGLPVIDRQAQPDSAPEEATVVETARPLIPSDARWWRPLFAAIAVALIIGAAVRYNDISHIAVVAVYIAVLVACAASDLATYRVPNVITYPAIIFALLIGAFFPDADFPAALIGAAAGGGLMLFSLVISRGAMGLGDVKLATFAGLALGWPLIVPALFLMALSGGLTALVLLLSGLRGRKDPIPYAPFIAAAALAVILWQGTVFVEL
jgi:prepilin signal peptidase PulO-like enzyme (type II secretory pathway)